MRIIISPAKQMRIDTGLFTCTELSVFMEKTEILMRWMQSLSYEEQKKLWACSDKIARQNSERFAHMDLRKNLTPALLAYDGIQYTYMAPAVFEDGQYDYVQEHLRILSGFYGVVKPLYREVLDSSRIIINLASKEYSKCIEKYLQPEDRYITCVFGEPEGNKIVQKGVYAKMARGEMVRYMAANAITEPEEIKAFDWSGYRFREDLSSDKEYVFVRTEMPGKPGK